MAGRKPLPDIMSDVLSNTTTSTNQQVNSSINQQINQSINLPNTQTNSTNTVKITFYMAENIASDMEDLWHIARKMAPAEDKSKVNRSVIGQELISLAINSLKDGNEKQQFITNLLAKLKSN